MQYIFLLYSQESKDPQMPKDQAGMDAMLAPWKDYSEAMQKAGVMRGGEALCPTSTATTVSPGPKEPVVTDGPFAETKEQLGGYYVVETENLDEALAWAAKCPILNWGGRCEVRPIMDFSVPES